MFPIVAVAAAAPAGAVQAPGVAHQRRQTRLAGAIAVAEKRLAVNA
jgi:hypothetical protein